MEIRAKCKFSKDSATALAHFSSYGRKSPIKTLAVMITIEAIIFAVAICEVFVFGFNKNFAMIFVAELLLIVFECLRYFYTPVISHKSAKSLEGGENEYVFYENDVKITSVAKTLNSESRIEYAHFTRAAETSRYFFLFISGSQAFVVDKQTVGTEEACLIRNKLTESLGKKYVICRY